MKKLPIGISSLKHIRDDDYVYIDKTHHVARLVNHGGGYFFLSRPRRFGKSLLLDTLKQAFLGNKEVFNGLHLENSWDWNVQYPVIHFDFAAGVVKSLAELETLMHALMDEHFERYDIKSSYDDSINNRFAYLINQIQIKYQQKVVVLIDEYDKPILDNILNADIAIQLREGLKNLYSVLKAKSNLLKFVLLTGVSKFSKVSLFSGLNNLDDISLNPNYADICGYTQLEMESEFAEYLIDGKVDKAKLKQWYNGYNFSGLESQKVYNPFDVLLFCNSDYRYKNYWFETATPAFLIQLLQKKQQYIPNLESYTVTEESLSSFDIDNIPLQTLLFQTGYLTIQEPIQIGTQYGYVLTYPNVEVKSSLNSHLMQLGSSTEQKNETLFAIATNIKALTFSGLKDIFNSHFASIPHDWYRNNPIGQYEGFYAGIIYSCFAALGYDLRAEDTTSTGRIDLTMKTPDIILVIEFKLSKYGSADAAIEQIINKQYGEKYKSDNRPIYLIGMSFDDQSKTMQDLKWQKA